MEQKRGGKMQEAVKEFEKSDEFSTASVRREGRDGELMCNGRNKRGTKFRGEFQSERLNSFKGVRKRGGARVPDNRTVFKNGPNQ